MPEVRKTRYIENYNFISPGTFLANLVYSAHSDCIDSVICDGRFIMRGRVVEGEKEIIEKLRAIHAPVIRWPGGCFAEIYDWRDGIGEDRPTRINWWQKNDGKYESNEVGTHEFMDFCEAVGAKAYFAANMTTVSPLHNRDWMDYCLSPKGSTTLAKEREANGHPEPFEDGVRQAVEVASRFWEMAE